MGQGTGCRVSMLGIAVLLISIISAFACPVSADMSGHMTLLATTESDDKVGSTADLYLEIRPGQDRLYIDTFPLTKLDTQISTRFAKEIACDYFDVDCSGYDFFYTLRSESVIIGGPSAGAAITMLTMALLMDWELDERVAVTGTINSGGFIGNIGGIEDKIRAAEKAGITKVLIPKGDAVRSVLELDDGNKSLNISGHIENNTAVALELGIELVEVASIDEVVSEFTGVILEKGNITISPSEAYTDQMRKINDALCNRAEEIKGTLDHYEGKNNSLYATAEEMLDLAGNATHEGSFYSSASFCFRADILLRELSILDCGYDPEEIVDRISAEETSISDTLDAIKKKPAETIIDIQAKIIVIDRLIEAEEYLKDAYDALDANNTNLSVSKLAYALERHNSAKEWSSFMGTGARLYLVDNESIRESCIKKLSEAEERFQFARLYVPSALDDTRKELDYGYQDMDNGDYELCLFKASKAKADADAILSLVNIDDGQLDEFLDIKLSLIERAIADEQEKGSFPILGYSYYEYTKSLRGPDIYSAHIFSEYALELSKLGMYFRENEKLKSSSAVSLNRLNATGIKGFFKAYMENLVRYNQLVTFFLGAASGVLIVLLLLACRGRADDSDCLRIRIKKKRP
ncbi:hypothetical protein JXB31_04165 [Candidatus Woesearchaeota archaeon]|nr:hypothetical protein [Candidatus Woesearchaeota archaeon]